jgi:hypothetical protein
VNHGSDIANTPGVRSVGCASVELFDRIAKRDLIRKVSLKIVDRLSIYSFST